MRQSIESMDKHVCAMSKEPEEFKLAPMGMTGMREQDSKIDKQLQIQKAQAQLYKLQAQNRLKSLEARQYDDFSIVSNQSDFARSFSLTQKEIQI